MAEVVVARRRAGLVPGDALRPLLARTNRHGLAFLVVHVGALVGTGLWLWAALGTWWAVPATVLYGIVLAHLFALLHECTHRTAFRARWANRGLAWATGLAVGLPPRYFALEHTAHHLNTQDADRDPELIPLPRSLAQYALFVGGGPYWLWTARTLTAHAAGRLLALDRVFVPAQEQRRVVREARAFVAVYAAALVVSLATRSTFLVWMWLVPRLVGEPSMRIARLSEHAGRPRTGDVTENTRSLRVLAPLRMLAWNMPYHAEHHASPSVPFHALPQLHALIAPHLRGRSGGYLAAQADIVRRVIRHEGPGV